ncbi:MAG: winged helix-turn-helix domain-containing protein, partial [Anaerolineaceae bacterium]|nr:winged helix-turn-helix domain-containing protein [Anaerolineaceae bacterium]
MLQIQLLGGFSVVVDGEAIPDERWRSRKARSLVKLLALAAGQRLQRDQVIDLLWPDSELDAAANNLHQALYAARRVLDGFGPGCLVLEEGKLSLSAGEGSALMVDVVQFEAAAAQAKGSQEPGVLQAALAIYTGELLPDDLYEEWAVQRRDSLRQVYLNLLLDLARLQETGED